MAQNGTDYVLRATGLRWVVDGAALFSFSKLTLPPGVTWVGGDEGCGKSTLIRLLAGDLRAPGSHLEMDEVNLADDPTAYLQQIVWNKPEAPERDALTPTQIYQSLSEQRLRWDNDLMLDLAEPLGLSSHLSKPIYMLSTGTKRKVWLLAALASGARVTLLDEPFAALDKASIRCLLDYLTEVAAHGDRAWVIADYQAPPGVPLARTIDFRGCGTI